MISNIQSEKYLYVLQDKPQERAYVHSIVVSYPIHHIEQLST